MTSSDEENEQENQLNAKKGKTITSRFLESLNQASLRPRPSQQALSRPRPSQQASVLREVPAGFEFMVKFRSQILVRKITHIQIIF